MSDFEKAVSIIQADEARKTQEFKNRLASSLKTDYKDLMSVRDSTMTIELGECMRDQLFEIFLFLTLLVTEIIIIPAVIFQTAFFHI